MSNECQNGASSYSLGPLTAREMGRAYLLQKNILRDEKDTTLETSAINLPILLVRDDLGKTIFESA